jgi:hypothetical protein
MHHLWRTEEEWIQCNTRKDWAHEACVDINPADYTITMMFVLPKKIWSLNNTAVRATRLFSKQAEM